MKKALLFLIVFSLSAFSDEKVTYKYKKYEKFDFETMDIGGELGAPGDLSIAPRYQKKFTNELPYRKNFNDMIRNSIERIR
ncbi:MAG: hypothetical protein ACHQYQ_05245 [Bacteriovoracales bacterium]|jgi:hypothetical protein